jgi:hypothetical protein
MGDRNLAAETGHRSAQGTGGVALNDQQLGRGTEERRGGLGHLLGMGVGVGPARTGKAAVGEAVEAEGGKVERRVLTGDDQPGRQAVGLEGMEDRSRLDSLGTSADDG